MVGAGLDAWVNGAAGAGAVNVGAATMSSFLVADREVLAVGDLHLLSFFADFCDDFSLFTLFLSLDDFEDSDLDSDLLLDVDASERIFAESFAGTSLCFDSFIGNAKWLFVEFSSIQGRTGCLLCVSLVTCAYQLLHLHWQQGALILHTAHLHHLIHSCHLQLAPLVSTCWLGTLPSRLPHHQSCACHLQSCLYPFLAGVGHQSAIWPTCSDSGGRSAVQRRKFHQKETTPRKQIQTAEPAPNRRARKRHHGNITQKHNSTRPAKETLPWDQNYIWVVFSGNVRCHL